MISYIINNDYIFSFQAKGKIIVYNQQYVSYGITVQYRAFGAREAAKVGGVASLIRSVTPFSIYSPHTGWQVRIIATQKMQESNFTFEEYSLLILNFANVQYMCPCVIDYGTVKLC